MLRLPRFRYHAPATVAEAVRILAGSGPEAMFVAGGTDVYPKMKRRQFGPKHLVGLRRVAGLRQVEGSAERGLALGANLTLTELAGHDALRRAWPAVGEGAAVISTPPLRNMGTLGGNLCVDTRCTYYDQTHQWRKAIDFCLKKDGDTCWVAPGSPRCLAVSSSDLAPVMIALGARYELAGPDGERTVDASDFYDLDGIRYLTKRPGEVLTRIHLPPAGEWKTTYRKLRRREAFDFPICGVAVAVRTNAAGEVAEARIAVGGVASRPLVMAEAAAALVGRRPTLETIREAASKTYQSTKALDNTDLLPIYRKKMVPIFTERNLRRLLLGESC
mgnify:CR=1 FL=1